MTGKLSIMKQLNGVDVVMLFTRRLVRFSSVCLFDLLFPRQSCWWVLAKNDAAETFYFAN